MGKRQNMAKSRSGDGSMPMVGADEENDRIWSSPGAVMDSCR